MKIRISYDIPVHILFRFLLYIYICIVSSKKIYIDTNTKNVPKCVRVRMYLSSKMMFYKLYICIKKKVRALYRYYGRFFFSIAFALLRITYTICIHTHTHTIKVNIRIDWPIFSTKITESPITSFTGRVVNIFQTAILIFEYVTCVNSRIIYCI